MSLTEYLTRYKVAAHAMQSAVATYMNYNPKETEPKHLRVGVNVALVDHGALVGLLIDKGIITEEEYYKALSDAMEREVETYKNLMPGTNFA